MERYIADCLNSIYAQDMPEENYEVICVNDCSTDGTRSVIFDYSQRHSNLMLIEHEKNINVGAARNSGLEVAKGEYIWFVDPDDMIRPNIVNRVYQKAKANDAGVLFFNNEAVDEAKIFFKNEIVFNDTEILSGQEFVVRYFPNQLATLCIVWRCLFKTSFVKEKGICFPTMCKGEDVSFLWRVLIEANRVKASQDICYSYRKNPYSIEEKKYDPQAFFAERILLGNEIIGMLGVKPLKERIHDEMLKAIIWCANSNLYGLSKMSYSDLKSYYKEIVNHKKAIKQVKVYMNRKSKMLYSLKVGKRLWPCIVKFYLRKES